MKVAAMQIAEKRACARWSAHGSSSPILDFWERTFNFMSLLIE